MKAIIFKEYGGIDKLMYTDVEKPIPGEGEVLIKIYACGVNPVDAKIREGLFKDRVPFIMPIIPGWDLSGTVIETGHAARRFKAGDGVYAYARRTVIHKGTYAEYIALPECYITSKPKNLNFEEAAAVPLVALTAYQSLFDKAAIKKDQSVLIIGASGGVGSFAVQFAKIAGTTVYAVASGRRTEYLKKLGADYILNYEEGSFKDQLKKLIPEGVDTVFDCKGGESTIDAYSCLKENGSLVSILSMADENLVRKHKIHFNYCFVEPNVKELDVIRNWIEESKVKVTLQKIYDLKDAAQAQKDIDTGHTMGKIVLKID